MKKISAYRFKQTTQYLKNFRFSLGLIFLLLIGGIIGFIVIENYSFQEAFYMTIITISTVGYGEVRPLSESGRMYASILIILNMGIITYALSNISAFIIEGELKRYLKDYQVYKKIQKLTNHIIVCGYGKHGQEIVAEFLKNKMPFVLIERSKGIIEALSSHKNILFLEGDATQDEILLEAGVERAMAMILTFPDDTDNLFVVLSARQINANLKIISRASNPQTEKKLLLAGASHVVIPERLGGFYMATLVNKPDLVEFFTFISNMESIQVLFEEIDCASLDAELIGKSIKDLQIRSKTGASIIGLRDNSNNYTVNPSPDTIIHSGMRLVVLGDMQQIKKFKSVMLHWEAPS